MKQELTSYVLNLVLLYQDALAEQWTGEIRERVFQVVGPHAARCDGWRISDLSAPEIFKLAVARTVTADVIVVSLDAAEEFPRDLQSWIDAWLPLRLQTSGALVALVSLPDVPDAKSERVRERLNTVARKGGLDFMVEERARPTAALPAAAAFSLPTVSAPGQVLYPTFSPDASGIEVRHWGINE